MEHIKTVSRMIEVCRKYQLSLVLTFVVKVFDSIKTNAILSALVNSTKEWMDPT